MTGSKLLFLNGDDNVLSQDGSHPISTVTDDHNDRGRLEWTDRLQDPTDQRPTGERIGNLGQIRHHPLALTCGEDNDVY
jgi:hypothetical protein